MKNRFFLTTLMALWLVGSPGAVASVTVNFDSLNAYDPPYSVTGATLDSYLASYGVWASNVTGGSWLSVNDDRRIYGNAWVVAPSAHNVLMQVGLGGPIAYTLNFAVPQAWVGFSRAGLNGNLPGGISYAEWTATAYDAAGHGLDTEHESMGSTWSVMPVASYTLSGAGMISYVTFSSNNYNFAAFSSILLDDLTLATDASAVPEPSTLAIWSLLGGLGVGIAWWRKRKA